MKFVQFCADDDYTKKYFVGTTTVYDVLYVFGHSIFTKYSLLKILFKIHYNPSINARINLPFKMIWYKLMVPQCVNPLENSIFIIGSGFYKNVPSSFFIYLKKNYKCKLCFRYSDKVSFYHQIDINKLKTVFDNIQTYNSVDSKDYSISLHPPIVFNLANIKKKPLSERKTDVLFVGRDKGRMDLISSIYRKCISNNFIADFYVIENKDQEKIEGIHYTGYIPYGKVVEKIMDCKCILNIMQPGTEGITIRDIEAYNYGCFILTNYISEKVKAIYNDSQVIEIGNINHRIEDIRNVKECFPKKPCEWTLDNYFHWVKNELS